MKKKTRLPLNLIISIKEARKILGVEAQDMSDAEVEEKVLDLSDLAIQLLKELKRVE